MKALALLFAITAAACASAGGCAAAGTASAQPHVTAEPLAGGGWFKQKGCTDCHSISAYQMWNIAAQGPDLSLAVEDVPKRFGRSLEDFLHEPSGTMAMVLSSRIPLTAGERDVAIAQLHAAYRRHQGLPDPIRPISSH
ncbi:MAG TPA: hypothetical protein VF491_20480 [Vicinamibacterales bacterium]|jgi:hypothetical protein